MATPFSAKDSSLAKHFVRPVVVYPGWFVTSTPAAKSSDVWVLNPKALPTFINHGEKILSSEDVSLYAFHLSRYIRSSPISEHRS